LPKLVNRVDACINPVFDVRKDMDIFNQQPTGIPMETPKTTVWQLLLNIIFFIPVTLRISGKWLCQHAYSRSHNGGWGRTIFINIVGVLLGIAVGWQSADTLAFVYELGTPSWILTFVVAGVLTYTHVWASLYHFVLRYIFDVWDKLWSAYERLWREGLLPTIASITNTLKMLPGSSHLWSQLQNEYGSRSKGVRFLEVLLTIGVFATAAFIAYETYQWVLHFNYTFVGFTTVAVAAGLSAGGIAIAIVSPAFDSKSYSVVTAASTLGAWALVTYVPAVAALQLPVKAGVFAGAEVFGIAYAVPGFVVILQGGLMRKILTQWKKLLDSAYGDESDRDYLRFFQHVSNIVLAAVLTWASYVLSIEATLPLWLAYTVATITAVYSYAEGFQKHFGKDQGNRDIAAVTITLAAFAAYHAGFATSTMVNLVLSVVTLFGSALIVYPMAYITLRALTRFISAPVGVTLESIHSKLSSKIVAAFASLRAKQDEAFNDRSDFAIMFGHLLNIGVLATALVVALPAVSPTITNNPFVDMAIIAFVGINGFVLLGRLFTYYSGATLAFFTGMTTLATVGYYVNGVTGSWITAGFLGLFASGVVGGVIAPLFYLYVAKKILSPFTDTLAPIVIRIFDALWTAYKALWTAVGRQIDRVLAFLAPIMAAIARTWQTIAAQIGRIFGA